jgi:hypothetical protein
MTTGRTLTQGATNQTTVRWLSTVTARLRPRSSAGSDSDQAFLSDTRAFRPADRPVFALRACSIASSASPMSGLSSLRFTAYSNPRSGARPFSPMMARESPDRSRSSGPSAGRRRCTQKATAWQTCCWLLPAFLIAVVAIRDSRLCCAVGRGLPRRSLQGWRASSSCFRLLLGDS